MITLTTESARAPYDTWVNSKRKLPAGLKLLGKKVKATFGGHMISFADLTRMCCAIAVIENVKYSHGRGSGAMSDFLRDLADSIDNNLGDVGRGASYDMEGVTASLQESASTMERMWRDLEERHGIPTSHRGAA